MGGVRISHSQLREHCRLESDALKDALSGWVIRAEEEKAGQTLTFNIILDGALDLSKSAAEVTSAWYAADGTLQFLADEVVTETVMLLYTRASVMGLHFLCAFMGHLRSPLLAASLMSCIRPRGGQERSQTVQKALEEFWCGEAREDEVGTSKSLNTPRWVDKTLRKGRLPLVATNSATQRVFRLIARDAYGSGGYLSAINSWETQGIARQIGTMSTGHITTANFCCPFNALFAELIFTTKLTSSVCLKESEVFSFAVLEDASGGETEDYMIYKLFNRAAGGWIDNCAWLLEIGTAQAPHRVLLCHNIEFDSDSSLIARMSKPFDPENILDACYKKIDLLMIPAQLDAKPKGIREDELTRAIERAWLSPSGACSLMHIGVDIEECVSVLLLLQLLWMNIPKLRGKFAIVVATPTASLLATSVRLLIDSMNVDVRNTFIKDKLFLVGTLFEGFSSKRSSANETKKQINPVYCDTLADLHECMEKRDTAALILSTPRSRHEGWTKVIYDRYIAGGMSAQFLRPVDFEDVPPTSRADNMAEAKDETSILSRWEDIIEASTVALEERIQLSIREQDLSDEMARQAPEFADTATQRTVERDTRDLLSSAVDQFFSAGCRGGIHVEDRHATQQSRKWGNRPAPLAEEIAVGCGICRDNALTLVPQPQSEARLDKIEFPDEIVELESRADAPQFFADLITKLINPRRSVCLDDSCTEPLTFDTPEISFEIGNLAAVAEMLDRSESTTKDWSICRVLISDRDVQREVASRPPQQPVQPCAPVPAPSPQATNLLMSLFKGVSEALKAAPLVQAEKAEVVRAVVPSSTLASVVTSERDERKIFLLSPGTNQPALILRRTLPQTATIKKCESHLAANLSRLVPASDLDSPEPGLIRLRGPFGLSHLCQIDQIVRQDVTAII